MAPVIEILNSVVETPDNPSDCALVVGLPLEKDPFIRKLNEGPDENFARSFRASGRSNLPESAVYLLFKTYADLAKDVIQDVTRIGVTVIKDAKLSDFASTAQSFRVVTLLSHTRDARFCHSDVLDWELLRAQLNRSDSRLRRVIEQLCYGIQYNPSLQERDTKAVIKFLNQVLEWPDNEARAPSDTLRLGEMTRRQCKWANSRRTLEEALPHAFQGGSAIEFLDGFAVLKAVLNAIPASFRGKLDLTSCNSTVLSEDVRRKCQSCLVLANEQSTSIDLRFAIYRQVIRSLSRRPEPYEDAVYRVRKELITTSHG